MICEKRHYTVVGEHGPIKGYMDAEKMVLSKSDNERYIGHGSTHDYIAHSTSPWSSTLAVLNRELLHTKYEIKPIPQGVYGGGIGGYHGSELNSNSGLAFSKEQLQTIIDCMGDKDKLVIYSSDTTFDNQYFKNCKETLKG